jgi:Phage tail baseplate hub (GPD)
MFNVVLVDFPETTFGPQIVYSLDMHQERYAHELIKIVFKDWDVQSTVISPGTAVQISLFGAVDVRQIYGYVHHIVPTRTPGTNHTEVVVIGASFPFKKPSQNTYTDITADQVVQQIAAKHGFVCYTTPHPRVYPLISQAGDSDWSLMSRLAKQCGYTLRAENTELYFQPMLEDFTTYREEALIFSMRTSSDPRGSSLYSFIPEIGESIPYDDATKAAVAITGIDRLAAVPSVMSHTQQSRNKTTKRKSQIEFFDRFDVATVVQDPETARHEAEAADNRNSFPYRASAEVLGYANLRPGMPIYLEGVGEFSGYWTILKTHHMVVEEELNRHRYTTILEIGTDSLGKANIGNDSKLVTKPTENPKRTIIPGVKQTKIKAKTVLNKPFKKINGANKGSFGTIENRAKVSYNGKDNSPATWKSGTKSLSTVIDEPRKPTAIVARLAKRYT